MTFTWTSATFRRNYIFWGLVCVAVLFAQPSIWAQNEQPASDTQPEPSAANETQIESSSGENELTTGDVQEALAQLPKQKGDAPASRDYTDLKSALDSLADQSDWKEKLAKIKKSNTSSEQLEKDQERAQKDSADLRNEEVPATEAETEAALKQVAPELQEVSDRVIQLSSWITSSPQRRLEETQRLSQLKNSLSESQGEPTDNSPSGMATQAGRQAMEAEIDYLEYSIATADSRKALSNKQLELARTREELLTAWKYRLNTQLKSLRADSFTQQQKAMKLTAQAAAKESPVLKKLSKANAELFTRRKDIDQLMEKVNKRHDYYKKQASWITARLNEIEQRVGISGFSQAAAEIMLKELRRLPHAGELETEQSRLEEEVRATQLELVDLTSELSEQLNAIDQIQELGVPLTREDIDWIKANEGLELLAELLQQSRELNTGLRNDANTYFELLLATDSEIMAARQATDRFRDYASENILWIPSRDALSSRDLSSLPGLMGNAMHEFTSILDKIVKGPVMRVIMLVMIVMLMAIVLFYWSRWTRQERMGPVSPSEYSGTLKLLFFEVCVALSPLAILHLLAWSLNDPQLDGGLANAIEYTARSIGPAAFFLVLLYRISLPHGLAELHLRWSKGVCICLRRAIRYYLIPALCFGVISIAFDQYGQIIGESSGSRLFLIPSFLFCLIALHVLFNPKRGILATSNSSLIRNSKAIKWGAYFIFIGWQGFLSTLVIGGYMLGAVMLWGHTFRTFWLVASILIIKGLIERYLEIQQWSANQQEREEKATGQLVETSGPQGFALDDSTKQVIGFLQWVFLILGVSAVWSDAFPSLRKLGSHPFLTMGGESFLTLGQLSMLLICLVTTVLLARSLPRLLEILVLRRIESIDPGSRHAFSTLLAYVVVIIGVIWASSILKIEWGEVQWLVAAISVGLGFGMQEIFGNLVAGIILLFERPIRVGDIVTVGGTTGKVTRIQMRGTTIMEWDRRELIVPNKEFVTGQLTNWTLSDTLTRLTLNVGVAYGSDISQVKELLLEAIKKDHRVLSDPAPAVFFKEFGESSLDFLCFAYLGTLDERLGVSSDLQQEIYEALNAANINIPLPQRDLHIIDGPAKLFPSECTTEI